MSDKSVTAKIGKSMEIWMPPLSPTVRKNNLSTRNKRNTLIRDKIGLIVGRELFIRFADGVALLANSENDQTRALEEMIRYFQNYRLLNQLEQNRGNDVSKKKDRIHRLRIKINNHAILDRVESFRYLGSIN